MPRIQELEQRIKDANTSYRNGEQSDSDVLHSVMITDTEYDTLLEELEVLDPNNSLLTNVGIDISDNDSRKEKLPIIMASMNKVKTVDEIHKWIRLKKIPKDTDFILTPKFDGASLCVDEWTGSAWTRGNGIEGQRSDEHLKLISKSEMEVFEEFYTIGELIIPRKVFLDKYSDEFSNPRNLVAGQLNHKTPNEILRDCHYKIFGCVGANERLSKLQQLELLNERQRHPIAYKVCTADQLTTEFLQSLFEEWNIEYEIDGIIIEVNDNELRNSLGRETSSRNPAYARAYKGNFEEIKESIVLGITWQISKKGLLKPVINIETIRLDGVNVSNITGNNAKFMMDMGIGVGTILKVKRSGMVIPMVVSVVKSTGFKLPTIDGVSIEWNESGVELVTTSITSEQRLKQLISFFEIIEVEDMGEGICKQFFDNGFDTPKKVLSMTKEDMLKLDKFGERKATKIINNINDKRNVTLSKLQHASGFFDNLGSKKLLLLEDLYRNHMQSVEHLFNDIITRDGFSNISAENYINGLSYYRIFEEGLGDLVNVSLTEVKNDVLGGSLDGMAFLFTGVRLKEKELLIKEMGGVVKSSISKNVTHLVCKDKSSTSGKMVKAKKLGLTIMDVNDLEKLLSV